MAKGAPSGSGDDLSDVVAGLASPQQRKELANLLHKDSGITVSNDTFEIRSVAASEVTPKSDQDTTLESRALKELLGEEAASD